MRLLVAATASMLTLAGCASSGTSSAPGTRDRVVVIGSEIPIGDETTIANAMGAAPETAIAAPPTRVHGILKSAYESLGIPVGVDDAARLQTGNTNFWKMRTLAKQPLSKYFTCGSGFTGLHADNYRIYISMLSTVAPGSAGKSVLKTTVIAAAQDVASGATERLRCGTTGMLEAQIAKVVQQAIANNGGK